MTMRALLLALSLTALAACGVEAPGERAAPATPPVNAAPAPAGVTDANMLTPEQISARLVGVFTSLDDENAGLIVTSGGKWTETYANEEPSMETVWRVFTGDQAPAGADVTFMPASRYLELKADDGSFFYELGQVSEDGFDMFYTARGNRLAYRRVKAPA
jgi:hypothetical protein